MTSNINVNNIDELYPVAGVDNDSQGFRDNFNNIKSSLLSAKSEIEDLQSKAVLKSQLIGDSSELTNDMIGNNLTNAKLTKYTEQFYTGNSVSGTVVANFSNGNYQHYVATGDIYLNFTGWPTPAYDRVAKITIQLDNNGVTNGGSTTYTDYSVVVDNVRKSDDFPTSLKFSNTNASSIILEAWSNDAGATVFVKYIGVFS